MSNQKIKHAGIVPLIGGLMLGSMEAYGTQPEYLLSYSPFGANDEHIVKYLREKRGWKGDYTVLDAEGYENFVPEQTVDVVSAVCPCAGLSSLSTSSGSDNPKNEWMLTTCEYVLGKIKPKVFWGENAPRLATKIGAKVRESMMALAEEHGYTFMIYQTKSLLHGVPQIRDRTFYFFFKEEHKVPVFPFVNLERPTIEELLRSVEGREDDELVRKDIPSEDLFYRFLLEETMGGMTHVEYAEHIDATTTAIGNFETLTGKTLGDLAEWSQENGFPEKVYTSLMAKHKKLMSGGGIMRKGTTVPKDYIGAFVGHMPTSITHPDEDRYLTVRECLAIMKMPDDFELINPKRQLNHICQNVPVSTAASVAGMVKQYLAGECEVLDADYAMIDNRNQRVHSVGLFEKSSLDSFIQ